MNIPQLGPDTPQFTNKIFKLFGRLILRISGWRFAGEVPNLSQFVMIGAPHTSNWDAYYGGAALMAMGIKIKWMGKHTLFAKPFSGLLTAIGGIPINRTANYGVVEQITSAFSKQKKMILPVNV